MRLGLLTLALLCGCAAEAPAPSRVEEPGFEAARAERGFAEVARSAVGAGRSSSGRALFAANCAACHGSGGQGDGSIRVHLMVPPRNLTRADSYRFGAGDRGVFRTVKFGIDRSPMPPWEGRLTDEEIWDVVAFVRGLQRPSSARAKLK